MAEAFLHITRRPPRGIATERWIRVDQVLDVSTLVELNRADETEVREGCVITTPYGTVVADQSIDDVMTSLASAYGWSTE